MRGRIVGTAAVIAVTAAAGLGAQAPAATSEPTLVDVGSSFPGRTLVLTLPQGRKLPAGSVTVTENNQPVKGLSVIPAGAAGGAATLLMIDASNSTKGRPLADAIAAAKTFAARNPGQPLAVTVFNDEITPVLSFTTDPAAVRKALAGVPATREGTHLNDAIAAGVKQMDEAGYKAGRIVVFSDGADVGSSSTRESALTKAQEAGVRLYTVGLASAALDEAGLQALASESGAQYAKAEVSSDLQQIYDSLGFRFSNEYVLLYQSLLGPEEDVKVAVKVSGYPKTLTTSYTTPTLQLGTGNYEESFRDKLLQSWAFAFLVAAAVVGLIWYAVKKLLQARKGTVLKRLGPYSPTAGAVATPELGHEPGLVARLERAGDALRKRSGPVDRFADLCDIGDVRTSPALLLVASTVGGIALGLFCSALFSWWAFFIGALLPIGVVMWVQRRVEKKRKAFAEQVPETLDVLAGALRAGHSLVGGFTVMAEDAPEPTRSEYSRALSDEQLGIPLDDALKEVGRRMNNVDMTQIALIALLQRETGSSSAEVIDQVAENVRGRMEVRRLVRVLTAQGRLARWIVSLMPVFLVLAILGLQPKYLDPLFNSAGGIVLLIIAAIMVVLGSLVIKRIVEIKV
jgi:tight adherence protein B